MQPFSYRHHQFPPETIRHAVWLYLRFTLIYRNVEELLAERGLAVSCETVPRWVLKFGSTFTRNLRRLRPRRHRRRGFPFDCAIIFFIASSACARASAS